MPKKKETKIEPVITGPTLRDIDEIWNVIGRRASVTETVAREE